MPRPVLLFDLDGTLADTAADLCETTNVILEMHGRTRVPEARVRHLVGGGARLLLERGYMETGEAADEDLLDQSFHEFLDCYGRHIADHTKLWPGVRDRARHARRARRADGRLHEQGRGGCRGSCWRCSASTIISRW